jgi:Ca-activated chloride channel homolog
MSWENDPYGILGLSPEATIDEVKSAYKSLARRLHPDVNPNNPAAAQQFQDITSAHELLTDSRRKRDVDQRLKKLQSSVDSYFTLQVTPSKRKIIPLPEAQVIYLLADIFPDPSAQQNQEGRDASLNLTLVLDHSNSMNGTRIEKVKIAAHQIIDNMNEDDILSVVTFNDRAQVVIPATPVVDRPALKAKVSMIVASGGTEIFKGLSAGVEQTQEYLGPRLVNHVILLTDGHTFGDQKACLDLAAKSAVEGIGISAMGLGHDWNDEFLDNLASRTGGNSVYINSAGAVVRFLNDHVRNLTNAFAERVVLSIAPDPDVEIESAFKLSPHPQPLTIEDGLLQLGSLQINRPISVLLQFQMPKEMPEGRRSVARLQARGEILTNIQQHYQTVSDIALEVTNDTTPEDPPTSILDALSKLTLYRLQERAQQALEDGDINEATRRLENLATRLLAMGQEDLAHQALSEARRVAHTNDLSDRGRKTLKYQTRYLLMDAEGED